MTREDLFALTLSTVGLIATILTKPPLALIATIASLAANILTKEKRAKYGVALISGLAVILLLSAHYRLVPE